MIYIYNIMNIMNNFKKERIALTMGDGGENHAGMEILGKTGEAGSGFSIDDLLNLKTHFETLGINVDYVPLKLNTKNKNINDSTEDAGVIILRNYLSINKQTKIYDELKNLNWDKKYYDTRRQQILNKHARYNLMFCNGKSQDADFENKKGRPSSSFCFHLFFKIFESHFIERKTD